MEMLITPKMFEDVLNNKSSGRMVFFFNILQAYDERDIKRYLLDEINICSNTLAETKSMLSQTAFFFDDNYISRFYNSIEAIISRINTIKRVVSKTSGYDVILDDTCYEEFSSAIYGYLLSYYDFFYNLFSLKENLVESQLIQSLMLDGWINLGFRNQNKKKIVSVFNPSILYSIIFACEKWNQLDSITPFYNNRDRNPKVWRPRFHSYIYLQKSARLLLDTDFFNSETQCAYKIRNLSKEALAFEVQSVSSVYGEATEQYFESISQSRMAEKIFYAYEDIVRRKHLTDILECIITGGDAFDEENDFEEQIKMLDDVLTKLFDSYNIFPYRQSEKCAEEKHKVFCYIDKFSQKQLIKLEFVQQDDFLRKVKELKNLQYSAAPKVLFVLDSLFLYSSFYTEEQKDTESFMYYLKETRQQMSESLRGNNCLNYAKNNYNGFADFKNRTAFQYVYNRLTAALKDPFVFNTKLKVDVRSNTIELFRALTAYNHLSYLYISENENFFKNHFNRYQFARAERYNGKDVKIIRTGKDSREILERYTLNRDPAPVQLSLYQFIKMFLSDEKMYCSIFDLKEEPNIIAALMDCKLSIGCEYRSIIVRYSGKAAKEYKATIEKIFNSIFSINGNKQKDTIGYCIRKGLYYAILGRAQNYYSVLLAYLIKNHPEFFSDVRFYQEDNISVRTVFPGLDNYAYLHNLIELLSTCEKSMTQVRFDELNYTYWKNGNGGRFVPEVNGLIDACEQLGYNDSNLYRNLIRIY